MSEDLFGGLIGSPTTAASATTGGSLADANRAGDGDAERSGLPLPVRMRPRTLDEIVGQQHLLAPGSPLRRLATGEPMSVFLWGPPGVGKSSLLNALCPSIDLKVGKVSDHTGLGRHTTTVSTLHALSGGGELVDTPGFRDFGLVDILTDELALHFPGFEEHGEANCRFRNCRHRTEPGCCIIGLVERGEIPAERYATYLELLAEVEADQSEARSKGWRNP
jgi:hypothetical protein